jgi:hypothetical protein
MVHFAHGVYYLEARSPETARSVDSDDSTRVLAGIQINIEFFREPSSRIANFRENTKELYSMRTIIPQCEYQLGDVF